jgi:hypothetical protein
MKLFLPLIAISVLVACSQQIPNANPPLETIASSLLKIPANDHNLHFMNDTAFWNGKKFSGIIFQLHPTNNNDTLSTDEYLNGSLHGVSKKWYNNHELMEVRNYMYGQKHGTQLGWWENGNKRFEFNTQKDLMEGTMEEWTKEGLLVRQANYVLGQESGSQKMWYENGKIRANYFIKNGRRFGLLGTKNCMNVSDSIFKN